MMFDADNGNKNWKDADLLEPKKIYNFDTFESLGTVKKARIPPGNTKIQVHLIYDCKQDGRYKAQMVASGNMTGTNIDNYYSSVISLHSICIVAFLYKLNNIDTRTGDNSNAYLDASTTEKIEFNTGPEFPPFGHVCQLLLIKTALYGLKSFCARFHSWLSDDLSALGLVPSMGGCDIWMRNEGDYYFYLTCYCNDPIVIHKEPDHVFESIIGKGFTIKDTLSPY